MTPTDPETPQTAAGLTLREVRAYNEGVKDGRAARDAEVRALVQKEWAGHKADALTLNPYAVAHACSDCRRFQRVLAILSDTPETGS